MAIAQLILLTIAAYLAVGVLVGVPFILRGVSRLDPAAAAAPWTFRALIIPGAVALWPIVLSWRFSAARTAEPGSAGPAPDARGGRS